MTHLRKLLFFIVATIVSMLIAASVTSWVLQNTIFSSRMHLHFFEKYDVYSEVTRLFSLSLNDLMESVTEMRSNLAFTYGQESIPVTSSRTKSGIVDSLDNSVNSPVQEPSEASPETGAANANVPIYQASGLTPAASGQNPVTSGQGPAASEQNQASPWQNTTVSEQSPADSGQNPFAPEQNPPAAGQQNTAPSGQNTEELIRQAVTPELVHSNLDNVCTGLISYFKGKKRFLPDIYLGEIASIAVHTFTSGSEGSQEQQEPSASFIGGFDRINLESIFLSLDRNDFLLNLSFVRFYYFILEYIPTFFVPLALLLLTLASCFARNRKRYFINSGCILLLCGTFVFLTGLVFLIASGLIINSFVGSLLAEIGMTDSSILDYSAAALLTPSLALATVGISIASLTPLYKWAVDHFTDKFNAYIYSFADLPGRFRKINLFLKRLLRRAGTALPIILILASAAALVSGFRSFSDAFDTNGYRYTLMRLSGNTLTEVISARDDTIYTLAVKVTEREGNVLPRVRVLLYDSESTDTPHIFSGITDKDGIFRQQLQPGKFCIALDDSSLNEYEQISPVAVDVRKPGTTALTIFLDKKPVNRIQNLGTIEIQIFDSENAPVEGLQLRLIPVSKPDGEDVQNDIEPENSPTPGALPDNSEYTHLTEKFEYTDGEISISDDSDEYYAVTNEEGISLFQVPEGLYLIEAGGSGLPDGYRKPKPFPVSVKKGKMARYNYRLSVNVTHSRFQE